MNPRMLLLGFSVLMMLPFFWFMSMGRRTFRTPEARTARTEVGRIVLLSGLLLGMWNGVKGAYDPARWVAGAVIALVSIALYESARRVIANRGFSMVLGNDVPQSVCVEGPYRFVRHPVYGSYVLAFLAMLIAFPNAASAVVFVVTFAFFVFAAVAEERRLESSPLGSAYAAYKSTAGMWVPRVGRRAREPGP